ncbi:hypothetical protein [Pseudomonas rhodesiae]|uniref:hypothetical protein n=1 Tax=Pseudomonas rhodesiae TaxID=76760 RepID=UPI000F48216F|nr:hypothetical protein [Pseudomonas rhodesiae]ROM51338.1 hypothetical protein BK650_22265 [Pseudomonas rhodesiae]ROM66662.1 hypothetical protein BK651_07835 [Pseudomonas rhodesiae]
MSFGKDIGEILTSGDRFEANLIIDHGEPVPIKFDHLELESYIKGLQLRIRLGIEDNPGSKNELTLEADKGELKAPMTYLIGPGQFIRAHFGLEGYVEYLPSSYWGSLTVNRLETDEANNKTSMDLSFSIGWKATDGRELEVDCSKLEISQ